MEKLNTVQGLSDEQVTASRVLHGSNAIEMKGERVFWQVVKEIVLEPMFIMLLAACIVYFVVGQIKEGIIMAVSLCIVAGISLFQEYRSKNAVEALKKLSASKASVIRNGKKTSVPADDIVVDDILMIEEGEIVTADGLITTSNDLSLNESILTGESFPVNKTAGNNSVVYRGTLVTSGSAAIQITSVGNETMLGKIGLSLKEISIIKTPLQKQIRSFVRNMVWIGAIAFLMVIGFNYYHSGNLLQSFLQGLTLAMSVLPEEIPVAFSTFQALGAFRLLKNQVIVKQPQYVETLGSATVICADKTGTITQNKMSIAFLYDAIQKRSIQVTDETTMPPELIEFAMWSSETDPFDPMEKAIHQLYQKTASTDKRSDFKQVHEYPVGGKPPMMTHIFKNSSGEVIIAAKGAPEAILQRTNLSAEELKKIEEQSLAYAAKGFRLLGVGKGNWHERDWPLSQEEFSFQFLGLIVFQDPPKENIAKTISQFYDAGIQLKIITGDYAETAMAIAGQIGLRNDGTVLQGKDIVALSEKDLREQCKNINIYARMFPEAKLKVINALKENGEIVAMTGDGVNDGPALKAAHIGIAMGKRGSEVAKSAASLILVDDDLAHMVDAVALGRKIYDNLKKAIQYIVSIHIPIILIVTLPLLLSWHFTTIFSPVHVIFLELIMGPTCSIIYENEPMEPGTMNMPPRKMGTNFLSFKQLMLSILQGLAITAGCMGAGYYYLQMQAPDDVVRTIIFSTLLFSNVFLTLVNRSFRYTIFTTLKYKNNLVPGILAATLIFIAALLYVPFMQRLFTLHTLQFKEIVLCIAIAFVATCWVEIWKLVRMKAPGKA